MKSVDMMNPSGTNDRLNIPQNLFRGEEKKTKKGKIKKGREFVLPHCYEVLKDVEKWKASDDQEESKKSKETIDLDDEVEASSYDGKRRPTPNSVAYSKPKKTKWK
ncbi:Tyrosine N-monooxygenase [Hordeum vulgare]|nr:Tyrosine N-monooxygenase [Hordeum vulgare]